MTKKIIIIVSLMLIIAFSVTLAAPPLCYDEPLGCPGFMIESCGAHKEILGAYSCDINPGVCYGYIIYVRKNNYECDYCFLTDSSWPDNHQHMHEEKHDDEPRCEGDIDRCPFN